MNVRRERQWIMIGHWLHWLWLALRVMSCGNKKNENANTILISFQFISTVPQHEMRLTEHGEAGRRVKMRVMKEHEMAQPKQKLYIKLKVNNIILINSNGRVCFSSRRGFSPMPKINTTKNCQVSRQWRKFRYFLPFLVHYECIYVFYTFELKWKYPN